MEDEEIYIDCKITRMLDQALKCKRSTMISGLTGSGKTPIVKSWLVHNKDKINGYYIDGTALSICPGETIKRKDLVLLGQMFTSETIDTVLSLPHTVVVVDNYHLLSDEVKEHVLLLCDGYVVDAREETGLKKLNNLEFVCAIMTTGL